ncbi:MAG: CbiX/SirB N-terminal domain-containing protein [Zoogloeaceae bacterium]|jgi:sirohydrochlorin cobaltochelatase|nr:CbiX/SirB N-terminal domain-containing protein [Zoogloeaceae bacterium]
MTPTNRVLALLGHGARDPAWADALLAVRAKIHARDPACRVELAFLEHLPPTLETLLAALKDEGGIAHVLVLPMFIASGGHLKRDLPTRIARLQAQFPQIQIELTAAIGLSDTVQEAMSKAALHAFTPLPPSRTPDRQIKRQATGNR